MKIILQEGKMIRCVFATLAILIALSSCTPATQATHPSVISNSATPSSIPTATQTSLPTQTPTASITSLPTIPTFTPTFDVSTIVTITPAPKAECPKEDNSASLDFRFDDQSIDVIQEILKYLNKGGSIKTILSLLPSSYYPERIRFEDLTGDGIPEFAYIRYSDPISGGFYIFSCMNGKYTIYKNEIANWVIWFDSVYDMNLNGTPELIVASRGCSGTGCYRFFILEWNGSSYVNLAPDAALESVINRKITDSNDDGVLELVLHTALLPHWVYQPWREQVHIFSWNGKTFAPQTIRGYQPQYRFQAIQDADIETTLGAYDTAFNLYKQAIFYESLEWWSRERQNYENAVVQARLVAEPTPSVQPLEDKTEYPRLAAYAYYRIMLLHVVQGNETDASTVYNTLQEKFGSDQYGRPYVEMASTFWNAYQSTHKMYDGCAAAIQYAEEHPEILVPLGSDYHGSQSKTYKPEDVCPFR